MSDEPENKAKEPKPPKIKAEDNPWHLLATLYGVPEKLTTPYNEPKEADVGLRSKNRIAWNRYFAANLDERTRKRLIVDARHPAQELIPFSPEELQEIERAFAERREASKRDIALPARNTGIDFSNVEFQQDAWFSGYLFSSRAYFNGAVFAGVASFEGANFGWTEFSAAVFSVSAYFNRASFFSGVVFNGATFDLAIFLGAAFSGVVSFAGVAFSGWAYFEGAAFSDLTGFDHATFSDHASFARAVFSGRANFGATFGKATSFVNVEMKGGMQSPLSQTATVAATVAADDVLTTTIDNIAIPYTVVARDTPAKIATNIASAINSTTTPDPFSGLPLNTLVLATPAASVVTITTINSGAPFDLACSFSTSDAIGYDAGAYSRPKRTATVGGVSVQAGDTFVTTINGVDLSYAATATDTTTADDRNRHSDFNRSQYCKRYQLDDDPRPRFPVEAEQRRVRRAWANRIVWGTNVHASGGYRH